MSAADLPHDRAPTNGDEEDGGNAFKRGIRDVTENFWQPFSEGALSLLPSRGQGYRAKHKRADRIPELDPSNRPLVRDYHAINDPTIKIRVPKKKQTPIKVETKVWFANERTFIAYLSMGLLLSTIASGLLFGARDGMARKFAVVYALVSCFVLVYGYVVFQKRITMISSRVDAAKFDLLVGPLLISASLFIAILANFIFKVVESRQKTGIDPLSIYQAWAVAKNTNGW